MKQRQGGSEPSRGLQEVNPRTANSVMKGRPNTPGASMRNRWILALLLVTPATAWATQPDNLKSRASRTSESSLSERLLPTPPMILRFGCTTSDLADLVAGLRASTRTQIVVAENPGILEFVCLPDSIIPWGAPLLRVYDLGLLGDLTRAEEFAARIGDQPFVVAPRAFPAPLSSALRVVPVFSTPAPPRDVKPLLPLPAPPEPIVRAPAARRAGACR
jgi:hypothetical protein